MLDGRPIERWFHESDDARYLDLDLEAGRTHPFVLDYFKLGRSAVLRVTAHRLSPGREGSDWLTRLTPMNFYPLICGAPDHARADRVLSILYDPNKFWLRILVPTVSKADPVWPQQTYWRGQVWPPCNYLVWLGVLRYADGAHQAEFARRSVQLFMSNWNEKRQSGENYRSTDGTVGGMPHYSWGPLLCEIAAEALAEAGPDFRPLPRQDGAITEHLVLRHIPFGGKLYRIEARDGKVTVIAE
jgi:putative isomerase